MARKSIDELIAQATADFPDNVTGLITPAKLRQWALDFLNAVMPVYSVLAATGPLNQTFGTAPVLVAFNAVQNSDPSQMVAAVPASTVVRSERGAVQFDLSIDFECQANRFVTFIVYKNGVATTWKQTGNGAGAGNPVSVSLSGVDYADPAATYSVEAICETNGTVVTMTNMAFVVSILPVRSYV